MLSTAAYVPKDTLALDLNGSKSYSSRKGLIQFARQSCGLQNKVAEIIFANVTNGVETAIAEMHVYAKSHPDFQASAEFLAKIFTQGLENLEK